ncbi:MAG: hypothetical protein M0Q91_17970 [Methanoregula sp.]|jgi:PKD repeat protein|nr:hypothetical protein [Methanoregula sp.]
MKQLLYLVMSLAVIAAIIPAASAAPTALSGEFMGNVSLPHWFNITPADETIPEEICTDYGGRGASHYIRIAIYDQSSAYINSAGGAYEYNYYWIVGNPIPIPENTYYFDHQIQCADSPYYQSYRYFTYGTPLTVIPIANFTGTPLSGTGPLNVLFNDTSTVEGTPAYNWTISPATGWYITGGTINSKDVGVAFVTNGNYTITHGVSSPYGSDIETKIEYIQVYNSTSMLTTHAVARDLYTGFAINGAQVNMYDVENTSWSNTTAINGEGSITTLFGHTIDIYGSATGYEDDNLIGVPAVDGGYYSLLLRPTNLTTYNSTPGNLTLAVTVQDLQIPHQTLSGAEVTAAWGAQYASGTSNAAGSVFFTVPNNTAIHLSAFKSGYASGSSTHITGSANGGSAMETAIVYIGTDYVTPTVTTTLTTGTGGTVPQTVDPYPCIGDGSAQDTANCQRKQGGMAADLIAYGPQLVQFFIVLTIIGGVKLMGK